MSGDPALDDIRTLLTEGEAELALQRLLPLVQGRAPRCQNEVRLHTAAWNNLRRQARAGTMTEEAFRVETAKLVRNLLELLGEVERTLERSSQPSAPVSASDSAPAPAVGALIEEKQLGAISQLRSLAWLRHGLKASRAVCRILLNGGGRGSGFLVSGNRLVTNRHVLPDADGAAEATFEFNYEEDIDGTTFPVSRYRCVSGSWRALADLDCAMVELAEHGEPTASPTHSSSPSSQVTRIASWGTLSFGSAPKVGDHVVIVQHPEGGLKQIAVTNNHVIALAGDKLHYSTDTLPGSSGSPVFDDRWRVVAMHRGGGTLVKDAAGRRVYANEGILCARVKAALDF